MRLNIGCGDDEWGDIRIDNNPMVAATHIVDLEKGILPVSDNIITEVRSYHCLEHIRNIVPVISEIFRVCVEGAELDFLLPYFTWRGAVADPTHVRLWNEQSFDHFRQPDLLRRLQIKSGWMDEINIEYCDHSENAPHASGILKDIDFPRPLSGQEARMQLMDTVMQFRIKAKVHKGCRW